MRNRLRKALLFIISASMITAALPGTAMAGSTRSLTAVSSTRYYYEQLSPWEKELYDAILDSELGKGPTTETVTADLTNLPEEQRAMKVPMWVERTGPLSYYCEPAEGALLDPSWTIAALTIDNAELSWLVNTQFHMSWDFESEFSHSMPDFFWDMAEGERRQVDSTIYIKTYNFGLTDTGYAMMTTSCDSVDGADKFAYADTGNLSTIKEAVRKAKSEIGDLSGKSDEDKVRAIHDWVLDHVAYADENSDRFRNEWRGYQTAYSALIDGVTVCTGYQKAFKLLCEEYGIPCVSVFGDYDTGAHVWANVLLDGAWYGVDCTNDDAYRDSNKTGYEEFLKGSSSFPHKAAPIWEEYDVVYPELSGADYSATAGWRFTDGRLTGVQIGTTLADLRTEAGKRQYSDVAVTGPNGESIRLADKLATGMHVAVTDQTGSREEYLLLVKGDVLGTGRIGLSQLVTLCSAFIGKQDLGAYTLAGDWSGNGKIDLTDVVQEARLLRN